MNNEGSMFWIGVFVGGLLVTVLWNIVYVMDKRDIALEYGYGYYDTQTGNFKKLTKKEWENKIETDNHR